MTPSYNRRRFLRQSAGVAAGVTAASLWTPPKPLFAQIGSSPEPLPAIEDPRLKSLVQRGLDASRSAGAIYADVRLTHSYERKIHQLRHVSDRESMTVGVRALVNGYWGFASGPVWSPDEMVRLGREATHHAQTNALGKPRDATLAPTPVVHDGQWATPVRVDPFSIYPSEVLDILGGIAIYAKRRADNVGVLFQVKFVKQDKAFGSSEGSYYTQRQYLTSGYVRVIYIAPDGRHEERSIDYLRPASVGFELFEESRLRESVDALVEEIKADFALPVLPVDVGRYDIILSASPLAKILSDTVGAATELDRALGYEANMTGTSYLNEPFEMLGTFKLGSPLLTVTMNRNEPGGAATVKWDDEGVVTRAVTLVKEGMLNDFQTTRESATWLHEQAPQLSQLSREPTQSTGSSYAPSGMDAPLAHTGNLVLQPSTTSHTVDDLVKDMKKGILFTDLQVGTDFQKLNGFAFGSAYEIRDGKKAARLTGAGLLFRAPELWKGLSALGGANSAFRSTENGRKGQPPQASLHSVTTVPAAFTQQTVIDTRRKA